MSVSVVNGFVCFSGCDAAKARKGDDPREQTNLAELASVAKERDKSPVVEFGGALAEMIAANAANTINPANGSQAADSPAERRTGQSVDLFV